MKILAQRVTASLAEDERTELESYIKQLEEADRKHDARSTWKVIKKLAGKDKKRLIRVRSKNGPFSDNNILSEWRLYFRDLLNAETDDSGPPLSTIEQPRNIKIESSRFNTSDFTREEVDEAIKSLKANKAPGVDNFVTAELLKGAGDYIRDVLRSLCNKILSGADPPWQWTTNKIVPVPKKGDLSMMTNYRGISLMSIAAKLYNKMLLERLRPLVDEVMRRNQAGFRRGRSTVDQICALRRIFEGVKHKKIPLVATFVDFKKAFDSVNRARLFEILSLYGIPDKLIDAIKKLYDRSKAVVSINGKQSESFDVTTGVLQGDVLAPFLFILVMDYVLGRSERQYGFEYKPRRSIRNPAQRISDLDFADDIVLLENSIRVANQQLEQLRIEAARVGLIINEKKTEVMTFNCDHKSWEPGKKGEVYLNNTQLKRVDDFKYLGSMMKSSTSDFECRRGLAWSAFGCMERIWKAKHLDLNLKLRIFEASVQSVLLYGCESWIVDSTMESKINSFATSCYRALLGISRLDRVPNEDILATVGRRPLINSVRRRQLGWLGHVLRRDEREPAKIFALYTPEHGKAKQGQPPNSYLKQAATLLFGDSKEITPKNIIELANNKAAWGRRTAAFRATID